MEDVTTFMGAIATLGIIFMVPILFEMVQKSFPRKFLLWPGILLLGAAAIFAENSYFVPALGFGVCGLYILLRSLWLDFTNDGPETFKKKGRSDFWDDDSAQTWGERWSYTRARRHRESWEQHYKKQWEQETRQKKEQTGQDSGPMSRSAAYRVLGVEGDATKQEIHKAYVKLMKQYHPDRHGSTEKAQEINEAMDIIMKGR